MSSLILIGLSPSLTEFLDSPSSMPIPNHFLPSQHQRHPPFKRFGQKSSPTPCSYKKFQPPGTPLRIRQKIQKSAKLQLKDFSRKHIYNSSRVLNRCNPYADRTLAAKPRISPKKSPPKTLNFLIVSYIILESVWKMDFVNTSYELRMGVETSENLQNCLKVAIFGSFFVVTQNDDSRTSTRKSGLQRILLANLEKKNINLKIQNFLLLNFHYGKKNQCFQKVTFTLYRLYTLCILRIVALPWARKIY